MFKPLTISCGMPSAPTVSHTPMNLIWISRQNDERKSLAVRTIIASPINSVSDTHSQSDMLGFNQATVPDHAHQTSGRVSAATKTKHKNLVATFVGFGEELVTLDNIDLKSGADRAANELIVPMSAHSLVVPFHLLDTICPRFLQGLVESSDFSFYLFIRRQVFIGGPVPSPIEAENDPFHKAPLNVEDDKLCIGLSILIWIPRVPRARQPPFPASRGCQGGGDQRNQRPPGIHRQAADDQTNDGMAQKVEYHSPKRSNHH